MCVASALLVYGSATKYFTSVCVNPIILKMKWLKKKLKKIASVIPGGQKRVLHVAAEHVSA